MAKKVRLYEVTLKNGHKEWKEIYPAQSEASLRSELNYPKDIKIIDIKCLGWSQEIYAHPDNETDALAFTITHQGKDTTIFDEGIGFNHPVQQCPDKVKEFNDFLNSDL